ncbi:MAG: endolytic transglycosylase MltG [Bacillota bacterium]
MKKAGIIFLIIIIFITLSVKIVDLTSPVDSNNNEKLLIEIKKGSSAQTIVDTLYINDLIKSRLIFRAYIHLTELDQQLKAGYYYLKPSMDMFEIVDQLKKGENAVFKVTIPEGYSVTEVINRLTEKGFNSLDDYGEVLIENNFEHDFLPEKNEKMTYRIEGYLYPETYSVPFGYNAFETIELLLSSFENDVVETIEENEITEEYSLHEIITIASLIEEEARFDHEKPIIASVIYNRLNQDMRLQIDATVQYVLEEKKERLLYKDLEVESFYNTYQNDGLPPGPICSPGIVSIKAALNPDETDYLFYFALENGEHVFTRSYDQHIQKQREMKNEGLIND